MPVRCNKQHTTISGHNTGKEQKGVHDLTDKKYHNSKVRQTNGKNFITEILTITLQI